MLENAVPPAACCRFARATRTMRAPCLAGNDRGVARSPAASGVADVSIDSRTSMGAVRRPVGHAAPRARRVRAGSQPVAPPCPGQAILGDAADFDVYRTQGSRDLTDLVLHARIVNIQGSCREGDKKTQLAVTAGTSAVELSRGPAMAGRNIEVPVFIAVADGETILDKRTYAMQIAFPPNVDRITVDSRRREPRAARRLRQVRRGLHHHRRVPTDQAPRR